MSPSELIAPAELIAHAIAHVESSIATTSGVVAYAAAVIAAALIVVSSFVKTMIPLRWLAVGSNAGFVIYGALSPSLLTLLLEGLLLPINIWRAIEMRRLTQRVTAAAASADLSGVWLTPYMKERALKAGDVLFRKGDAADKLYFLAEGRIELVEIGEHLESGRTFGEIAFFAPDKRRTLSARCVQNCTVLMIDEGTLKQLYFQNPAFGFQLVGLVAGRLSADVQRLERQLASSTPTPPPSRSGRRGSRRPGRADSNARAEPRRNLAADK